MVVNNTKGNWALCRKEEGLGFLIASDRVFWTALEQFASRMHLFLSHIYTQNETSGLKCCHPTARVDGAIVRSAPSQHSQRTYRKAIMPCGFIRRSRREPGEKPFRSWYRSIPTPRLPCCPWLGPARLVRAALPNSHLRIAAMEISSALWFQKKVARPPLDKAVAAHEGTRASNTWRAAPPHPTISPRCLCALRHRPHHHHNTNTVATTMLTEPQ